MTATEEFAAKLERVRRIMSEKSLTGLVVQKATNLAWLLGGAECWVARTVEKGSCSIVVAATGCHALMNAVEAPRLETEELMGLGIEPHVFPWHDDRTDELIGSLGGGAIGSDAGVAGSVSVDGDLVTAQVPLTDAEVERYRTLGADAGEALGAAMKSIEPGMTEHQVASRISEQVLARGAQAAVVLVAADRRVMKYRHPIPTDEKIEQYVMGVLVARRGGLHASLTRCVHFGELPADMAKKHQSVCEVDGAMFGATRAGATAGEVFAAAQASYAKAGYPEEWHLHHQGGASGYQPRSWRATSGAAQRIHAGQAFAWNPSLQGTKSEDTILCTGDAVEILTATPDWPTVKVASGEGTVNRSAILIA